MTSLSRATGWRVASRHASPTLLSGVRWSTLAPRPRASASTSRFPNKLSSPTSPCEIHTEPLYVCACKRSITLHCPTLCCRNVNGITFMGSVKEKTVARNLYTQARARGKAAGIIRYWHTPGCQSTVEFHDLIDIEMFPLDRANSQDMETFKTEVHVPPGSNIEFELHYQEMMQRKLGFYEHKLYLQPGRLVPQLQVRTSWLTTLLCCFPLANVPDVFSFRWMCTSMSQKEFPWCRHQTHLDQRLRSWSKLYLPKTR